MKTLIVIDMQNDFVTGVLGSKDNNFCSFIDDYRGKVFVLLVFRNCELNSSCYLLRVPSPFNLFYQFADIFSSSQ